MLRRPFTLAAGVSFALCIAAMLLWIAGYFSTIGWRFFSQDQQQSWTSDIETVRGGIQFRQDVRSPYSFIVSHGPRIGFGSRPPMTKQLLLGFGRSSSTYLWDKTFLAHRIILVAPLYLFVIMTAVLPVIWFFRGRRRRLFEWRLRNNRCVACGYDLHALPAGRCPECGS